MSTQFHAFRAVPDLDGAAAYAYQIASTHLVVFTALEENAGHSLTRTVEADGTRLHLGAVTSRPLAAEVAAMPFGTAREVEARRDLTARVTFARIVLTTAYPAITEAVRAGTARWRGGDLECLTDVAQIIVEAAQVPA